MRNFNYTIALPFKQGSQRESNVCVAEIFQSNGLILVDRLLEVIISSDNGDIRIIETSSLVLKDQFVGI